MIDKKKIAIQMRSSGMSIPDIALNIGISKSTASLWLRSIPVPNKFMGTKGSGGRGIKIVIKVGPEPKKKERVKNGPYLVVEPPKEYPGNIYNKRYAYEHHVVYWRAHGVIPQKGEIIHHQNENKHDNRIENLVLMTASDHSKHHKNIRICSEVS